MIKSVALCTYNGSKYLNEQLDSIINQTVKIDEIIICDDISTDTTINIINDYILKYPNLIKLYINESKLYTVKNFEKAIKLCSGDIIFLSDQDDIWIENKVEIISNSFTNNKNITAIATNGFLIDEYSNRLEKYAIWDVFLFLEEKKVNYSYFDTLVSIGNFATGATMAFKKEIVDSILPFPVIKDFYHDEFIALITSKDNKFLMLNDKLIKYRIHQNQQVGGVSYPKTDKTKREFVKLFQNNLNGGIFHNLKVGKRKLKLLAISYKKWKIIINDSDSIFLKEILSKIENEFYHQKNILLKNYPIRFRIISMVDKLKNKRSLK